MVNYNEIYNLVKKIEDLKQDVVKKTNLFVTNIYPTLEKDFAETMKQQCVSAEKKATEVREKPVKFIEKLFGKRKEVMEVPAFCFDQQTFDKVISGVQDWSKKNTETVKNLREDLVNEFFGKLNDIENSLDKILNKIVQNKKLEDLKSRRPTSSPFPSEKGREKTRTEVPPTEEPSSSEAIILSKMKEIENKTIAAIKQISVPEYVNLIFDHISKNTNLFNNTIKNHVINNTENTFFDCLNSNIKEFNSNPKFEFHIMDILNSCLGIPVTY